jgi:adenylate kinase family enzyme
VERVVVLGSGGAGKSLLATELGRRTGLPVVHLDVLFWRPGWQLASREEAVRALRAAVAGDRWILDGNFLPRPGEVGDGRFERADTVIFLDLPRGTCLRRVLARRVRGRRRRRPDLPEGCPEGLDLAFLRWVWAFPKNSRPKILELLDGLDGRAAVHRLRSPAEVERLLDAV